MHVLMGLSTLCRVRGHWSQRIQVLRHVLLVQLGWFPIPSIHCAKHVVNDWVKCATVKATPGRVMRGSTAPLVVAKSHVLLAAFVLKVRLIVHTSTLYKSEI